MKINHSIFNNKGEISLEMILMVLLTRQPLKIFQWTKYIELLDWEWVYVSTLDAGSPKIRVCVKVESFFSKDL